MILRLSLLLLGLLVGLGAGRLLATGNTDGINATTNTASLMLAGLLLAWLVAPRAERWWNVLAGNFAQFTARLDPRRVAAATAGAAIALLLGVLLSTILAGAPFYSWYVNIAVTVTLAVFFVQFAVRNANAFGGLVSPAPRRRTNAKVLDSNVIIDGRIVDLARSGFMEGEIIVPAFVLREMQMLADHGDPQKRTRGKRGLSVLEELREVLPLNVQDLPGLEGETVDDRLVRFTQSIGARLVTNDTNLSKVARLYGLKVLSINEAALAFRPKLNSGETIDVTVTKAGQQAGQGVAYLDDGTMIVIEDGLRYKGRNVRVSVVSNVQTALGRMVFAKPIAD